MTDAAPQAITIGKAVDKVMRNNRGRLIAGLVSRLGDFQLAEDALQEASVSALNHWGRSGIPDNPMAWLMKVALRKGIDRIRAGTRETNNHAALGTDLTDTEFGSEEIEIPDERLRLIFTCCHPALEEKSRIALTLRTVCNLTTREIAEAYLDNEPTIGQRISRAKSKIRAKGIGFRVPEPEQWDERLGTVLSTIYLIFTTGYVTEEKGPRDLCLEALYLARLLHTLRPHDPEIEGALALILLTEARREARIGPDGATIPVEEQNKELWNREFISKGRDILANALERQKPGPFQIKAAIADCHMFEPTPDWKQMSFLYQSLWRHEPTPVIVLNWSVVLAELGHGDIALEKLDALQSELSDFQPWHAARAGILTKQGNTQEAATSYRKAIELAPNAASRKFLEKKLKAVER